MDDTLRQTMLAYYNERAPEYEEAYTKGAGTALIPDAAVFTTEMQSLIPIVTGFGSGDFVDIACGTGYWVRHYVSRATSITLFDQSENMLAQARKKCADLAVSARCSFVQGDLFGYDLPDSAFDSALIGFLVSHMSESEEAKLFAQLQKILKPSGRFLILDSAWSNLRARYNVKVGQQQRRLNDGTVFDIYKRYLDESDIRRWENQFGAKTHVEHFGAAFCGVSGTFERS